LKLRLNLKTKEKITYFGLFLFGLSVIAAALNEKTAIVLLIVSFGTIIFGGLVKAK